MEELEDIAWRLGHTLPPLNSPLNPPINPPLNLLNPPYQQHSLLSQQLSSVLQDFQAAIDKNLSEIEVGMERLESRVTLIEQKQEQQHQNVESLQSTPPHQTPARW